MTTPQPPTPTPPLPLPRFTFLHGPNTAEKFELARLICAQDSEVCLLDLEAPLRDAIVSLFFDGRFELVDLSTAPDTPLPGFTMTAAGFMEPLRALVRGCTGGDALGRIALNAWRDQGLTSVFSRFLFRDLTNIDDALPFTGLNEGGSGGCLLISHNTTSVVAEGLILPPNLDPQACLEFLRGYLMVTRKAS